VSFVRREAGDTLVGLVLPQDLLGPQFPASLVVDGEQSLHLDALVRVEGDITVARTEEVPLRELAGFVVGFQQWWRADQLDAVIDVDRAWTRRSAPTDDHEHCLLDWTTTGRGGEPEGWLSGADWICLACHQRFLVEDHLRVRASNKADQ
jgi:hypothetical protein